MKTIKVKFHVSTKYVRSDVEQDVELEVDKNISDEELEKRIDDVFNEWVQQNINAYYDII